jgi:membrane-associated phospholipid phosphatase
VTTAIAAGLALLVHDKAQTPVDLAATAVLQAVPLPPRYLMWAVVSVGDPLPTAVLAVGVAVGAAAAGTPRGALLALLAPLSAVVATQWLLQPLVGRTLNDAFAYPSGHTVAVTSVAVAAGVVLVRPLGAIAPPIRDLVLVALVTIPVIVAVFLVALGLHYATDTIGGVCVSVPVVLIWALVIDLVVEAAQGGVRGPDADAA